MSMSADARPSSLSRTHPPAARSTVPAPAACAARSSVAKSASSWSVRTTASRTATGAPADPALPPGRPSAADVDMAAVAREEEQEERAPPGGSSSKSERGGAAAPAAGARRRWCWARRPSERRMALPSPARARIIRLRAEWMGALAAGVK